jgi:hypothetical protein
MPRMSQFEYDQLLARRKELAMHPTPAPSNPYDAETPTGEERDLQLRIYNHCKSMRWICCVGRMDHKTYRPPGEPDVYLYHPSGRIVPIEVKTSKGKISKAQEIFHTHAKSLGITVHVVRNFQHFIDLLHSLETPQP